MKRSSFLKSLLGIAAVPSIAVKAISEATPVVSVDNPMFTNMGLQVIGRGSSMSKNFISSIDFIDKREVLRRTICIDDNGVSYTKRFVDSAEKLRENISLSFISKLNENTL